MINRKNDSIERRIDEFLDLVARLLARKHLQDTYSRDSVDPEDDQSAINTNGGTCDSRKHGNCA